MKRDAARGLVYVDMGGSYTFSWVTWQPTALVPKQNRFSLERFVVPFCLIWHKDVTMCWPLGTNKLIQGEGYMEAETGSNLNRL